jgi:hypothetical protein
MEPFTLSELSFTLLTLSGALSGLLLVCWKSRCKTINICWGGVRCDRLVDETAFVSPSSVVNMESTL